VTNCELAELVAGILGSFVKNLLNRKSLISSIVVVAAAAVVVVVVILVVVVVVVVVVNISILVVRSNSILFHSLI
jgi:LytS/YehU family sensor histidine kinase